jgi:DNA mismatch repair protein MSH2
MSIPLAFKQCQSIDRLGTIMEAPSIAINITKTAKHRQIGACVLRRLNRTNADDTVEYSLELYDFLEENDTFANLDSFFIQIGSSICYFPEELENSSKGDGKKLFNILHGKDIDSKFVKRSHFAKKPDTESKILKLTGRATHATNTAETERPFSYGCVECLIHCAGLLNDDAELGKYDLQLMSLQSVMRIDSAAAEAVNLLPRPDHPSQFGSIFGVLNRCKTKMGSRLLERWLRQPLLNKEDIETRLDCVSVLKESTLHRNQLLEGALKGVPDVDLVLSKMQKKNAGLEEMFRMYVFSLSLPAMSGVLVDMIRTYDANNEGRMSVDSSDGPASMSASISRRLVEPLRTISEKFALYQGLVRTVIDMDQLPNLEVSAVHDETLMELREEKKALEAKANKVFAKARDDWASFADIRLELSPQHGYIMRSTKGEDERQLRANNKSVRILSILKNGVHFTVPDLENLADRIKEIEVEYARHQTSIVEKALETALTYAPLAEVAAALVAEVDVLVSFATAAALAPGEYVRPKILPRGQGVINLEVRAFTERLCAFIKCCHVIFLQGARHPCVELMDNVQFIPNNYDLIRGTSGFQIVTGPNMVRC